jgi:hypothetical protein
LYVETSGIVAPQAGFGQVTVRAQSQAMTGAFVLPGSVASGVQVPDPLPGLLAHPGAVAAHFLREPLGALPAAAAPHVGVQGLTKSGIGRRLVISPATARTHVSRAMLGARDRAQLVAFAYESGIVVPGRPAT